MDFVALPTHDIEASSRFYGETLGLRRSVYVPERNYAEFETGNLTLSVFDAEKMGIEHNVNRSGIALKKPFTEFERPAPHNPACRLIRSGPRRSRVRPNASRRTASRRR